MAARGPAISLARMVQRHADPGVLRGVSVAALSLLLGGVTSFAQGWLPHAVAPVANSASGWTLITAVLVFWARPSTRAAAVVGALSFVLLVLGYALASQLRGYYYSPVLFGLVGVVVGPFVGVAAAWLRAAGSRAALGTAVLAGIGVGEATYGLTTVRETTGIAYWIALGVLGLALLGTMLTRRPRDATARAIAVAGTGAVAAAFVLAYRALG